MPASKFIMILILTSAITASALPSNNHPDITRIWNVPLSHPSSSSLGAALQWLAMNQSANGSYGAYEEHLAAAAAYALWLNNTGSSNAQRSYSWLASQLNSSSAWFWGTEADVPGAVLYSIASTGHLQLVNKSFVSTNLLMLQQPHGGFEGYYDSTTGQTVTSSVDTNMALLGLLNATAIPASNETYAIQYLLSLQNMNGSFNLTRTIPFDPIYSLGPDPASITALTILTLNSAGVPETNSSVTNGLAYLKKVASTGFGGHVYAAAISELAFKAYDQIVDTISSTLFILSQQNCDGGFSDTSRSSYPQSNALDTGWAATALETQFPGPNGNVLINTPRVSCAPIAGFHIDPISPSVGTIVHFNATGSHDLDADQLSYNWTFGDGVVAQGINPVHTYSHAGNFTVTLTVTDSGTNPGPLSDTRSLTLTIQPATVQRSSTLTISASGVWIVAGSVGLVAIIGIAFYLGRLSAGRRTLQASRRV